MPQGIPKDAHEMSKKLWDTSGDLKQDSNVPLLRQVCDSFQVLLLNSSKQIYFFFSVYQSYSRYMT